MCVFADDASVIPPSMTFIPSTSHWASYYVITEADSSLTRPEYVTLATMTSYTSGIRLTYSNQTQTYVTGWSTYLSDATYSHVTLPITESFVLDHQTGQAFMVSGRVRVYTYRYTVTTRMTSLRWAAMRAVLMFH